MNNLPLSVTSKLDRTRASGTDNKPPRLIYARHTSPETPAQNTHTCDRPLPHHYLGLPALLPNCQHANRNSTHANCLASAHPRNLGQMTGIPGFVRVLIPAPTTTYPPHTFHLPNLGYEPWTRKFFVGKTVCCRVDQSRLLSFLARGLDLCCPPGSNVVRLS